MKYPDSLPSWFTTMNPKGCLSSRDIALLFGFCGPETVIQEYRQGSFPRPDSRFGSGGRNKKCFWKKSTVMAEITRRANGPR